MHPVIRAASTHARSRRLNTCARITRAVLGHSSIATLPMITAVPGRVSAASTSIDGRNGSPNTTSASRVTSRSTHPPRYPDSSPSTVPIATTATAAVSPTSSAARVP